jgi:hypothetical protein
MCNILLHINAHIRIRRYIATIILRLIATQFRVTRRFELGGEDGALVLALPFIFESEVRALLGVCRFAVLDEKGILLVG